MTPPRESLNSNGSGDSWDQYKLLILNRLDLISDGVDKLNATIESHKKDIDGRLKPLELKLGNIYAIGAFIATVAGILAGGIAHAF